MIPFMTSTIRKLFLLGFIVRDISAHMDENPPQLVLPWGIWPAQVFPRDPKIYLFQDVRFGAKPERFSAPSFPREVSDKLHITIANISCIQIDRSKIKNAPGGRHPLGDPRDAEVAQSEDCLFLDIYAPVDAFERGAKALPVIVWIYGGAYSFGSKNQAGPLYTGQSILKASNYQVIFIVGNYRVGTFGWLAGSYMQDVGQPNAGLYDQSLLFQWVQKYVDQVGGDKSSVTAWGESAGAGSILHHLIREEGKQDPLFTTFAVQSPAFEWAWDNSAGGKLDDIYREFSRLAGCGFEYNISCLRCASPSTLTQANQKLFNAVRQTGLFPVGPAVDGKWIKSIPTITLLEGKAWKAIDSAIISHCANEPHSFIPPYVHNQATFDEFLGEFLPGAALGPQRNAIRKRYDCKERFRYNFKACVAELIRDASFTCNTRDLFEAYPTKSYMMEYGFPSTDFAYHAADLIPLFMNDKDEAEDLLVQNGLHKPWPIPYAALLDEFVVPTYQAYLASFAMAGDPNKCNRSQPEKWPIADGTGDQLSNVMHVHGPVVEKHVFHLIKDEQNTRSACLFWTRIAKEISNMEAENHRRKEVLQEESHDEL